MSNSQKSSSTIYYQAIPIKKLNCQMTVEDWLPNEPSLLDLRQRGSRFLALRYSLSGRVMTKRVPWPGVLRSSMEP
jgi:hypothetical protein